ncbi:NADH-quinone oxidoreductase subunit L [Rubrobacter radiotolerans]|uniref:Proton-conducting transporter membrane subunit n=1 Tax=Rubrobacter radiotolerans TaxID=42256 RepID=A0AB35TB16_RUBRA|nr:proton-conducting transporter membrane subunit [Rubrobacter radiotolerans]MDX5895156.1 proton-conducting transporter membrane subunit [Rubrobacter radiotolerans]SMC07554.1 NADH-quinone oxidoreductase subunit L [Rubrobacter radiotolerans DSM 5868]
MSVFLLGILTPIAVTVAILLLRRGAALLAVAGSGLGLVAALFTFMQVAKGTRHEVTFPGLPEFPLRLIAEPLTALLSVVVWVVGFLAMVYAVGYMKRDSFEIRFYAGMMFFIAAMQMLVLAGDWVLLLASWEMIGFASYLLIGHYSEREGVASAATRAFLYTRTADLGLYVAVFILVTQTGTTEIEQTLQTGGAAAFAAGLLLIVAAAGKSAQIPFSGWLRDAMVGPTPVSALLHSATLVAAGAILIIRISPLLPQGVLLVTGLLGGLTIILAGFMAIAETDLKRLLAASTSSQYGFMLLAIGAGSPFAALAHLLAHAAMKSSLFLGAGIFQTSRHSTRFDALGGVGREHKLAYLGFAVSALALAGIPPLSGFFSKDAIISATRDSPYALLFGSFAIFGTLLTGVYVARAMRLLWRGPEQTQAIAGIRWMGAALGVLALLSTTVGFMMNPLGNLLGTELPKGLFAAILGITFSVAGLALGWFVPAPNLLGSLREPALRGFGLDGGIHEVAVRPALAMARTLDRFDRRVHSTVNALARGAMVVANLTVRTDERGIDGFILALVDTTRDLGGSARRLQSGLVHRELVLAVVGGGIILAFATVMVIGASSS